MNDNTHYLLMCLVFLNSDYPLVLAPIPLAIYSFYNIIDFGLPYLQKIPFLGSQFTKARARQADAVLMAAHCEIMTLVVLVLLRFTGHGSILAIIMYFQFLQYRYIASATTRLVFGMIGSTGDRWMNHPRVPGLVRQLYFKIKSLLGSLVRPRA